VEEGRRRDHGRHGRHSSGAPAAAASLAAQGNIITAAAQAVVGTRVQGDTVGRPFVAAQGSAAIQTLMQQLCDCRSHFRPDSGRRSLTFLGEH
jgi:hypothetical protein